MNKSLIIFNNCLCISLLVFSLGSVQAEATVATESTEEIKKAKITEAELDQMMAPIALYPDSLLAQILMASTYPSDLTEAVKWSKDNPKQEGDAAVKIVQTKSWDPSVMSLVAFPQVLAMMAKKPDWIKKLGEAFLSDSERIMDSVQKLRKKAKEQGNLKSSDEQKVITEEKATETIIIIEPAKPETVYVPVYNTTVVYGTWWWPHYTPWYYYPPHYAYNPVMPAVRFAVGVGITYALWSNCHWGHGRGSVNINVNKFNNINIDRNKLDGSRKNQDWNRKDKANRDNKLSDRNKNNRDNKLSNKNKAQQGNNNRKATEQRKNHRGRDNQRDKARSTLNNRAINPSEGRKKLQGSAGNSLRSSINKTPSRSNSFSKNQGNYRSSNTRNNAFSGSRSPSQSRQSINRGNHSNRSMSRSRGGGGRGRR